MQKKWNVLVVPNSPGKKVYTFRFSPKLVLTAAAMAASLFILTSTFVLYAGSVWRKSKLEQVSELQTKMKFRDAQLSRLNQEFSALEELADKVREAYEIKSKRHKSAKPATESGGKGGPESVITNLDQLISPSEDSDDLQPNFVRERRAPELLQVSLDLKDNFLELLDFIDTQRQDIQEIKLTSVPSLNPVLSPAAWISSGFGYRDDPINGNTRFHEGCDIVAPRGTPIAAPADGVVTFSGWREGLGRTLEVAHGKGYSTCYGHAEKLLKHEGDIIKRGDVLAYVGTSGRSTGPHLHYEVRRDGKLINPYKFLIE